MNKKQIHPLIDKENQHRAKKYTQSKRTLNFLTQLLSWIILLLFYTSGLSAGLVDSLSSLGFIPQIFIFFTILIIIETLLTCGLNYWSEFKVEHRYGFSTQDINDWILDQIKSFILTLIIGAILLILLFLCFKFFSAYWWLVAAFGMIIVSVIFSNLFPVLIIPLFYKLTPVKDEILKDKLKTILEKSGIKIEGFYSMNMSSKTTKENAMLAGLFNTKRVILGDNLLKNNDDDEIEVIIAHEVGHHKHQHTAKIIIIGALQVLILFLLIHLILTNFFPSFLTDFESTLTLLPIFLLFFNLLSFVTNPFQLFISRLNEKQADRTALSLTDKPDAFIKVMAGLANRNLSDAYPSPIIKFLFYSHPPVGERIDVAKVYQKV